MYSIKYKSFGLIKEVSIRKARKIHFCSFCGLYIKKGERYVRIDIKDIKYKYFKSYNLCKSCLNYLKMLKNKV